MSVPTEPSRSNPGQTFATLLGLPICSQLRAKVSDRPCHIVGGALRDVALGLVPRDLDLVIAGKGRELAQRLASELGLRQVELGGDRFTAYRLVGPDYTIDLWDRRHHSLEQDLQRRDLTIHSFALEIGSGEITDPFDGLGDLERRCLRATTSNSFTDDPLRLLRLCRFATRMPEFRIDDKTLERAAAASPLSEVAAERVRTELELILSSPFAIRAAELLVRLSLYPLLWSGNLFAHEPSWLVLPESFSNLEAAATWLPRPVDLYNARMALMFALLPPAPDAGPSTALTAFRSSGWITKKNAMQVARFLEWNQLPRTEADRRWFLHRLADQWPNVVAYLAARYSGEEELASTRDEVRGITALARHSRHEIFDPAPLISGDDLLGDLGLPAGAWIGRILAEVRRHQIEGEIGDRHQALELARQLALSLDLLG